MDKRQAQEIIRETFEAPFDKERFTYFIKNLLNSIDESKAFHARGDVKEMYRNVIKTYERIGTFTTPTNEKIDIIIAYLQKGHSLDHARVTQRNFAGRYLVDRGEKDAGIFAFVSPGEDWRFSLVKMDYRFEKTATGKTKVKEEFTPARRWSFLVGANEKSHTAQSRLVNILSDDEHPPTLQEIEKSFDIETVTREFFLKYRELFIRTKEALDKLVNNNPKIKADFETKGVDTVNFAKKLLGQIIFLYFLQKKGWFGVGRDAEWGMGSKQFLRELFEKKHGDYKNFFNDILEPLFYEALRIDRGHDDHYYSRFDCKIPFLNGGLFDPIGNYAWVHTDILLPDNLFSNNVKTKEGDTGDGILDVFDRYNFTVKEDEPLEKEVAIDPELLGKAYEKFNAIRPDNFDEYKKALKSGKKGDESKFNKQFGVYYTPREIVHYMCRESLINYLFTEISDCHSGEGRNPVVSREDIETLIHLGEHVSENEARVLSKGKETRKYYHQLPESIRKNAKLIDDKLADITVCDPAVGSGAFPVGMMSEIVRTRTVLSTFINSPSPSDKEEVISLSPIEKGGTEGGSRTTYNFKRRCIEHSLYGVDIDPGAVEIAKLRLWLSLVVDEDDIKNIKPLPNLDYKIMQGNSLIEFLSTESLVSTQDYKRTELVHELKKVKDELFNITSPTQKENKRREIDMFMKKLFEYDREKQIESLQMKIQVIKSQQRLFEDEKVKKENEKKIQEIEIKIEELKKINVAGPKIHFEWHINYSEIFQERDGFNVVIGNPPWGADLTISDSRYLSKRFPVVPTKTKDSYFYFISQAIQLLRDKGFLVFITPNTWLLINNAKDFRRYILSFKVTEIIDYGDGIFEQATVESANLLLVKEKDTSTHCHAVRIKKNEVIVNHWVDKINWIQNENCRLIIELDDEIQRLLSKLKIHSVYFDECCKIIWGIKPYQVGYGIPPQTREMIDKRVYHSTSKKGKEWKPLLVGANVNRYTIVYQDNQFIKYGEWLMYPSNEKLMKGPKILMRQTSDILRCCYDEDGYYCQNSVFIIHSTMIDLKFLLGLLNSNLIDFVYKMGNPQ